MLSEWHLPPDYIVNHWTDELLSLMTTKLVERKERMFFKPSSSDNTVSTEMLAARSHGMIEVKHGD